MSLQIVDDLLKMREGWNNKPPEQFKLCVTQKQFELFHEHLGVKREDVIVIPVYENAEK